MLTRTVLLQRLRASAPTVWRFVRDGLVHSGAGWVCGSAQPGCDALPCTAPRPTRQDVRRGLAEIERYLAAHV